jgi:phenylacetate-CoA oxygenase PaaH subunit
VATFEVFGRRKFDDPLTHVGAVHAADPEAALLLVRETHFRHNEGVDFAVVATDDIHRLADPTLLERKVDDTYRQQAGYSGFRDKRQAARDAADARGLAHVRDRVTPRSAAGS